MQPAEAQESLFRCCAAEFIGLILFQVFTHLLSRRMSDNISERMCA